MEDTQKMVQMIDKEYLDYLYERKFKIAHERESLHYESDDFPHMVRVDTMKEILKENLKSIETTIELYIKIHSVSKIY